MVMFQRACVEARLDIVIAGGVGSGKTTILALIAGMIPDNERIILIQDASEVRLPQKRVVGLKARPGDLEGRGAALAMPCILDGVLQ